MQMELFTRTKAGLPLSLPDADAMQLVLLRNEEDREFFLRHPQTPFEASRNAAIERFTAGLSVEGPVYPDGTQMPCLQDVEGGDAMVGLKTWGRCEDGVSILRTLWCDGSVTETNVSDLMRFTKPLIVYLGGPRFPRRARNA